MSFSNEDRAGEGLERIRCKYCQLPQTTSEEYRMHLIDSHYELLTDDELNGIVVIE